MRPHPLWASALPANVSAIRVPPARARQRCARMSPQTYTRRKVRRAISEAAQACAEGSEALRTAAPAALAACNGVTNWVTVQRSGVKNGGPSRARSAAFWNADSDARVEG